MDGGLIQVLKYNDYFKSYMVLSTNIIAKGEFEAKFLLTSSRLIPLIKDGRNEIRPIAVGEIC